MGTYTKPYSTHTSDRFEPLMPNPSNRFPLPVVGTKKSTKDSAQRAFHKRLKLLDKSMYIFVLLAAFVRKSAPGSKRDKIGVIKLAAMGDALCLLPSLRELKKAYPESKVIWLTTRRINPEFFTTLPFIDQFYVITPSIRGVLALLFFLWKNPVDVTVDFDQYYLSSELMAFLWGRGNSIGYHTPLKGRSFALPVEYDPQNNERLVFYDLVLALQGRLEQRSLYYKKFSLFVPEILDGYVPSPDIERLINSIRKDGPMVAIYPGAGLGASFRRWGIEKYIEVAKKCIESGCTIVFLGGKDEEEYKKVISQSLSSWNGWHDLIGSCSLRDTAYVISRASVIISNDGGLLHFCHLFGTPCVSIFGPGIGIKWAPMTDSILVEHNGLPCKPCIRQYLAELPETCKIGTRECLTGITADEVFEACQELLKTSTPRRQNA
jgi:ADP-heptose:LPS heptosyltransferase